MIEGEGRVPVPAPRGGRGRVGRFVGTIALLGATLVGGVAGGSAVRFWSDSAPSTAAAAPTAVPPSASGAGINNVALVTQGSAATVYAAAGASVVTVSVSGQGRGSFFQPVQGEGSGFIVDDQGRIVTNNHVVEGARSVFVTLADGTRLKANVIGTDPAADLAVLQADVPKDKLTVARLGDSSKLAVGEPVVAIGAPFGLSQSVTAGIVSALNRTFGDAGGRPMRGLIQTDAPINPGNSGGPLFNLQGEVVGITTSIESPVRASVGIGFAIPSNTAKTLLPRLAKGEQIDHPYLGISGQQITSQLAESLKLPVEKGVLVALATPGGPAAKAGIRGGTDVGSGDAARGGDIITAVDGQAVGAVEEISGYLDSKRVGDTVKLDVLRDGKQLQINVTLGAWPKSQEG